MYRHTSKLLVGAIALTLLTVFAPSAVAQSAFGGQVVAGDGDLTYALAGAPPGFAICFVDDDGSATYNPGEPIYAQVGGCGAVAGNDLRLTAAGGQAPGTQVRATHTDFGNPSLALGGTVDFYDADGDALYSLNDPVYYDIGTTGAVAVGDLHLTGTNAGTTVKAGDSDINNALFGGLGGGGPGAWDFFDADGDGAWTAGDVAYIDPDASVTVTIIDVRLGSIVGEPFGSQVVAGDQDLVYALAGAPPGFAICFVDDDGSATYNPGEPIYAQVGGCGAVAGNDLRLTAAGGQAPGTQVRATHTDFGNPSLALGGTVDFYDADGDALYSLNDPVYYDIGTTGAVAVGDLALTGANAGTTVKAGDSDINNALFGGLGGGGPGAWDFFDADGDGAWTAGDVAYVDPDASVTVTVIDVRLGANVGEPFGSQVTLGDADLVYALAGAPPGFAICFVDDDGSATYNPGEPIYAQVGGCGAVAGNDLRLTAAGGQAPGSQVRATHTDFGNPSLALGGTVDFYDADGDALYSLNDPVYYDIGTTGAVAVGDLHLSGTNSGTTVKAGDSDINNALFGGLGGGGPGAWDFFDADGDGAWTAGDIAYVDPDASVTVTVIDIRLGTTAPTKVTPPTTDGGDGGTTDGGDGTDTGDGADGGDGEAPPEGAVDEQARQDAADAKASAEEAKDAAEAAQMTAEEAKTAAEQAKTSADAAKDAAEGTRDDIADLTDLIESQESGGTPGFGLFAALIGLAGAAFYVARRKD